MPKTPIQKQAGRRKALSLSRARLTTNSCRPSLTRRPDLSSPGSWMSRRKWFPTCVWNWSSGHANILKGIGAAASSGRRSTACRQTESQKNRGSMEQQKRLSLLARQAWKAQRHMQAKQQQEEHQQQEQRQNHIEHRGAARVQTGRVSRQLLSEDHGPSPALGDAAAAATTTAASSRPSGSTSSASASYGTSSLARVYHEGHEGQRQGKEASSWKRQKQRQDYLAEGGITWSGAATATAAACSTSTSINEFMGAAAAPATWQHRLMQTPPMAPLLLLSHQQQLPLTMPYPPAAQAPTCTTNPVQLAHL